MQRRFGVTGGRAASRVTFERFSQEEEYQGEGFGWSQLLECQRILLDAKAGAGKTHECKVRAKLLFQKGEPAFSLRLEAVASSGVRL